MSANAGSLQPIDNLLARVSAALRRLPEAVELYIYGSAADPDLKDSYSDLDLQVITADFALSQAAWPQILEQAGKIKLAFPLIPLMNDLSASAYTITFQDESPYHKVDIGLCAQDNARAFLEKVGRHRLIWKQPSSHDHTLGSPPGEPLLPQPGSAAYFLLGEMLSAVRYVKARKRQRHLSCWRFLSAKMNALLRCFLWDGNPARFPEGALLTGDYTALDQILLEDKRLNLLTIVNCSTPEGMDTALIQLTRHILAEIQPHFNDLAGACSAAFAQEYLDFIIQELALPD